jgi:putative transposase
MRKSKFTESQIVAILKEGEAGVPVAEVCRKHGISSPTYYAWKSKYAGATVSDLTRMRELEAENARLKRMYADLALENAAIKDVLTKNSDAVREAPGGGGHGDRAPPVDSASLQSHRLVAGGVLQGAAATAGEGCRGHRRAQRRRRAQWPLGVLEVL